MRNRLPRAIVVVWTVLWAVANLSETSAQDEEAPTDASVLAKKLRAFDKNGDGQLSPDEMSARGVRRMVSQAARYAGLSTDGPISIQMLVDATNARRGKTSEVPPKADPAKSDAAKTDTPTFGAPGAKSEAPKPAGGFGQPSVSVSTGGSNINNIEFAEGLLKQKDTNKNGVIDGEEIKELKERYHAADANKDGAINRDELIARVTELNAKSGAASSMVAPAPPPTPAPAAPGGSAATPPRPSSPAKTEARPAKGSQGMNAPKSRKWWENVPADGKDKRKTFKAKSPSERLPKGLPDFFGRSDADGDGQVSMAEFSVTWNDSKAAEFAKYDLDEDGLITVDEALAASAPTKK